MKLELNEKETELVTEMLKAKKDSLPTAIHHCSNREFKVLLKNKEKMVEDLLVRMSVN